MTSSAPSPAKTSSPVSPSTPRSSERRALGEVCFPVLAERNHERGRVRAREIEQDRCRAAEIDVVRVERAPVRRREVISAPGAEDEARAEADDRLAAAPPCRAQRVARRYEERRPVGRDTAGRPHAAAARL